MKYSCIILALASTLYGQVSITVYNQNRALVKEVRTLEVPADVSNISFRDVAAYIDPTSVHFKSLTSPDKLNLLEQNYEYDLVGADKILDKYVDHEIRLVMKNGEVFTGLLLTGSGGNVVLQEANGGLKVIGADGIQHFAFPSLPEGLITRPTLVWLVDNKGPRTQKTELSYLTSGMNWHAEYVGVVNQDDKELGLSGWVSLENNSGATFRDARLKLVAGDVNIVRSRRPAQYEAQEDRLVAMAAEKSFEEKAFFEYHLYTLTRPTTLKNNQTKQIALFPSSDTKATKLYVYEGSRYGEKVRVLLEFVNSETQGLGLPLPKGTVRIYKQDSDGQLEFVGEDAIDHTPVDEKVRLLLGNAFDLVGERIQKERKTISQRVYEESVEVTLRNHKETPVTIFVEEYFSGDWQITKSTHAHTKKTASQAEFAISVPAKGESKLVFTVTTKY